MLETFRGNIKELIFTLAMVQVLILMIRIIIPRSIKRTARTLMKYQAKLIKLTWKELKRGAKLLLAYYEKGKEPTRIEQAPNVIPFPSIKKIAK